MKESKEKMRDQLAQKLIDIAKTNKLSEKEDEKSHWLTQKLISGGQKDKKDKNKKSKVESVDLVDYSEEDDSERPQKNNKKVAKKTQKR